MNEEERQRILEVGSYRARLDQLLAALPPRSDAAKVGETYAQALWEYALTWKERLSEDEWDHVVWEMIDMLKHEEKMLDDE